LTGLGVGTFPLYSKKLPPDNECGQIIGPLCQIVLVFRPDFFSLLEQTRTALLLLRTI
jgi:hypothetical protein